MAAYYKGNAQEDGAQRRGWLLGAFMPADDVRRKEVEIKWGIHKAGEKRDEWANDSSRTTFLILISGSFTLYLREETITLTQQGDYVLWEPGTEHRWEVNSDCVVMTIRWPEKQPQN